MALSEQAALNKDKRNAMSDMQHRHFATIAHIIRTMPGNRVRAAYHFADELAKTNPRFDRARFLAACDVEG